MTLKQFISDLEAMIPIVGADAPVASADGGEVSVTNSANRAVVQVVPGGFSKERVMTLLESIESSAREILGDMGSLIEEIE